MAMWRSFQCRTPSPRSGQASPTLLRNRVHLGRPGLPIKGRSTVITHSSSQDWRSCFVQRAIMSDYRGQEFPDEFAPIVSRLLDKSAHTDPLELDLRKRRVLARLNLHRGRRSYMRSRIATVLAIAGFAAGSGGALALANSGSTNAPQSAAMGQYCLKKDRDDCGCKKHHPECHHHKCKDRDDCNCKGRDNGKCEDHHCRDRDHDHDCDRPDNG
jgi:hypothetical protein